MSIAAETAIRPRKIMPFDEFTRLVEDDVRDLDFLTAAVFRKIVEVIVRTGNRLVADDAAFRTICPRAGLWKFARQHLLEWDKIEIVGTVTDSDGTVVHPGFVQIPWLNEVMDAAGKLRTRARNLGLLSAEKRKEAAARRQRLGNGKAVSVDHTPPENALEHVNENGVFVEPKDGISVGFSGNENPVSVALAGADSETLSQEKYISYNPERESQGAFNGQNARETGNENAVSVATDLPNEWRDAASESRARAGVAAVNLALEWESFLVRNSAEGETVTLLPRWRSAWIAWALKARPSLSPPPSPPSAGNENGSAVDPSAQPKEVPAPFNGHVSAVEYDSWLARAVWQVDEDQRRAVIRVPTRLIADHVSQKLDFAIRAALRVREIDVQVDTSLRR